VVSLSASRGVTTPLRAVIHVTGIVTGTKAAAAVDDAGLYHLRTDVRAALLVATPAITHDDVACSHDDRPFKFVCDGAAGLEGAGEGAGVGGAAGSSVGETALELQERVLAGTVTLRPGTSADVVHAVVRDVNTAIASGRVPSIAMAAKQTAEGFRALSAAKVVPQNPATFTIKSVSSNVPATPAGDEDWGLPATVKLLLETGHAVKVSPSLMFSHAEFKCTSCSCGFNLDHARLSVADVFWPGCSGQSGAGKSVADASGHGSASGTATEKTPAALNMVAAVHGSDWGETTSFGSAF